MVKKSLLVLVLVLFLAGWSFAQTDFRSMPKNTITVDIGPTFIGLAVGVAGNVLEKAMGDDDFDFNTSSFGIGVQYERQILESFSVAGRFAYLRFGAGLSFQEGGARARADADLSSISAEGHARFYPFWKRAFFLDAMLGYGNLSLDLDGSVIADGVAENISERVSRHYLKFGGKLGWRIDFGKQGGFVFEPSFGFNGAVGLGDTIGKKVGQIVEGEVDGLDEGIRMLENFVFIGGPRLSLAFGWRF